MEYKRIVDSVPEYLDFMTVKELEERNEHYRELGFKVKEIGKSLEGRPVYLVHGGKGKKIFLWAFPHPNEPIGSLTIDFLIDYLAQNKELFEKYEWYFIPCADPDGAHLNEGWFKGKLTLEKYFLHFFRQSADRMIDWNFPIKYKEACWDNPLVETRILAKEIDIIKPDLMSPLHNAGFGGAYFLSTRKESPDFYKRVKKSVEKLGIPLHLGEPEEPFMKEYEKPFYDYFGFKDYYDYSERVTGKPPKLEHGDNSPNYLRSIRPEAVTIAGEVPYFSADSVADQTLTQKTRRTVWLEFIDRNIALREILYPIAKKVIEKLKEPAPYYYLAKNYVKSADSDKGSMRKHVLESEEYNRQATVAEVFEGNVLSRFYSEGLRIGQVRRAAIAANLEKATIDKLTKMIKKCAIEIEKENKLETFPIRKLVQLQIMYLFETLKEIS